ncbi:ABC transporter ATP-binding protein [Actinobacillus equuli]|nr:ABC transporter ATP-binding protein [Actinobacillus equuli]
MLNKFSAGLRRESKPIRKKRLNTESRDYSVYFEATKGMRGYLVMLTVLVAAVGIIEAVLFQFMGELVDWVAQYSPAQLWAEKSGSIIAMFCIALLGILFVFLASSIRFQSLQGVFPMRLRWNFHRLMLGQSMGFYQDEFAGRVSAKVMQTALAVRDVIMTCADMLVYVAVYLTTSSVILLQFDGWLFVPFILWVIALAVTIRIFVPKLAEAAQEQSDARSLMTGRITDAYSNIATVNCSHTATVSRLMRKNQCKNLWSPCINKCVW